MGGGAWRRFARESRDTAPPPRALVHSASGGVGTIAVQYLRNVLGCHVTATCSAAKAAMVRDLGANETIDYHTQRFEDVCGAAGVDVVFDVLPYVYCNRTLAMLCEQPPPEVRQPRTAGGARPPLPHYVHVASSDPTVDVGGSGADCVRMAIPEASPAALCRLGWNKIARFFGRVAVATLSLPFFTSFALALLHLFYPLRTHSFPIQLVPALRLQHCLCAS